MTSDELQQRFLREIEKRAVDDKYIDGQEEREFLQIALQHGFTTDQARSFLVATCRDRGYVIEAAVITRIREAIRKHAFKGLSQRGFEDIVTETRPAIAGTTQGDNELRRLILTTLDDTATRIRRGWFRNWHARLRRDIGVA